MVLPPFGRLHPKPDPKMDPKTDPNLFSSMESEHLSAGEARWAHNPKVPRSKLGGANQMLEFFFFSSIFVFLSPLLLVAAVFIFHYENAP